MVAAMRAVHQVVDHPRVFDDPVAVPILGAERTSDLLSQRRKYRHRRYCSPRAMAVARSVYAEEELAAAVGKGCRQYVVLGAGLDTFACRNPYEADGLHVFEVDHPATQAWKQQKLEQAGIPVPESMTFVPIDFQKQALAEELQRAGFDCREPAIFSWLGVTMYLPHDVMMGTLDFIATTMPTGSGIVFDYITPFAADSLWRRYIYRAFLRGLKRMGEPWVNLMAPATLVAELKALGFSYVQDISADEVNTRLFSNRTDKLELSSFVHLMIARI